MYDGPKITSGGASSAGRAVSTTAPAPRKALDELNARAETNNVRLSHLLDRMRRYADETIGPLDDGKIGRERNEPPNRIAAVFEQSTTTDALIDGLEAQFNRIETI